MGKRKREDEPFIPRKKRKVELFYDIYENIVKFVDFKNLPKMRLVCRTFNYLVLYEIKKRDDCLCFKNRFMQRVVSVIGKWILKKVGTFSIYFSFSLQRIHELIDICLLLNHELDRIYLVLGLPHEYNSYIPYHHKNMSLLMLICKYSRLLNTYHYIQKFIDNGCNINKIQGSYYRETTVLIQSTRHIQYNSINTIKLLLESGANPNMKDYRNQTPLIEANKNIFRRDNLKEDQDIIKMLISFGAKSKNLV